MILLEFHLKVILIAFALWLLHLAWQRSKGRRGELAVALGVKALGLEALHDVILPDGRGGLTQIDHIIRLPVGLAVVETKAYSGAIYGQKDDATWTQVMGRRKYPFQNPLRQNYLHVKAVRALVPEDVEVFNHVLFVGSARFKTPRPDDVTGLWPFLWNLRRARSVPVPVVVEEAWTTLRAAVRTDAAARRDHLEQAKARRAAAMPHDRV